MIESPADPSHKRRWRQFRLWHLFLLLTVVALACASIKYLIDFRLARTNFYDAIQLNEVNEVRALLHRYPSLIRTTSPTIRVPGDFSVYTGGETPVSVAVLYESRDTFDYLLTLHPDLNARGAQDTTPLIWATCADDIHYLDALLKQGADCTIRDRRGKTASDYARQFGKRAFLDLIAERSPKQYGARANKAVNPSGGSGGF